MSTWNDLSVVNTKEFIPLGTFWSGDWVVPEQDIYAQTTGRDRLELLRTSDYSTSEVLTDISLYDLAITILTDAGLTSEEYFIDTELQDYIIPYAYFDNQSHREALRKIAEACLGQIYCDRDGILRIEGNSYLDANISVDTLTKDDYLNKDNPTRWSSVVNYIEVETQPLKPDTLQEIYKSNELINIGIETKTLTVFYNNTPCINAIATLTGTGTISDVNYYSWGASITVTSGSAGTFEITINGQPLKVLNKSKIIKQDLDSIKDMGKLKYIFPINPLIQTVAVAEIIANKLLSYYKNPRRDIEIDWRGNPSMLLGDKVTVVDDKEENDYYIVKQELEFDGGLRSKLSGRRV